MDSTAPFDAVAHGGLDGADWQGAETLTVKGGAPFTVGTAGATDLIWIAPAGTVAGGFTEDSGATKTKAACFS